MTVSIFARAGKADDRAILALGPAYFMTAVASIGVYHYGQGIAGVWIPNVLAVAVLRRRPSLVPLSAYLTVFVAAIAANLVMGSSPGVAILFAVSNTAEVLLSLVLLSRWVPNGANPGLLARAYVQTLAIAGGLVPAAVGLAFSVVATLMLGWPIWPTFTSWWTGDALGYAIFLPFLTLISLNLIRLSIPKKRLARLMGATLGCAVFAVAATYLTRYPFVLMLVPLLVAAAYFPPLGMAIVCAITGSSLAALGIVGLIPHFEQAIVQGDFQLSVAVIAILPFLASLLLEEMRQDRRRIAESEQRFRRAMEDSAIGMALVTLDGRILEANHALAQMFGYSTGELQQRTFFELTYPEDRGVGRETVRQAVLGEVVSYQFEKRYVRKDGIPVWTLVAGSVIRDQTTNAPLYLVSQIEDINARKSAEAALVEAEGRWSFALESAGQGVWDFDRRTQRTYYSPVWKKIVGYEEHELTNDAHLWLGFIHPDDLDGVLAIDHDYKAGLTPYFEAEFRMRHKDGRWIWVLDRGKVLERHDDGTAIRAIGTHTDITLQKEAEERLAASAAALAEEKERLRITLHSIADAVICTDASNRVTFMNPAAEDLTGFDIVAAYGESLETVFAPIDEETGEPVALMAAIDGTSPRSEQSGRAVLVRRDRTRRSIREVISPILTAKDDFAGSAIVFQDVTDARALQRDLAYAASHDPLTGLANRSGFIRSLVEVLETAGENGTEHALLFIDLDRFKAVNDRAGHLAGDALLKAVAKAIKSKVRSHDNVSRFGGDEFAVLLRSCPREVARTIAEMLVATVRDLGFTWEGQPYQIGASIGVAPIDCGSGAMDDIVAQADEACYASKKAGRGCVSVFGVAKNPKIGDEVIDLLSA